MRTFLRMLAVMIVILENPAAAQLKGTHLPGDAGLKSGSQVPPGFSIVAPVYLQCKQAAICTCSSFFLTVAYNVKSFTK